MNTLLQLVEKHGWKIFPLTENRTPAISRWQERASNDIEKINNWKLSFPGCAWGLVTGAVSGVYVIDLDVKHDVDGIAAWLSILQERGLENYDTVKVTTGSGGIHIYFKYPDDGARYRNTAGKIGAGIDTRGDGGYVVVPPSTYDSTKSYEWSSITEDILPLPEWIKELLDFEPSGVTQLHDATIPKGERNNILFRQAAALRRRGWNFDEIKNSITYINERRCEEPLDDAEITSICSSAAEYAPEDPMLKIIESTGDDSLPHYTMGHDMTDLGNAKRLQELCDDMLYIEEWRRWVYWTGQYWKTTGTNGLVNAEIFRTVESIAFEASFEQNTKRKAALFKWAKASQSASRINSIETVARSLPGFYESIAEGDIFDTNPYQLNVQNGVVDLITGKLLEHEKEYMQSKICPVVYNPAAEAPRWRRFLFEIMEGDEEMVEFLQRAIGYSISGDISEKCFFILHGSGRNGKSTFLETIANVLGTDYAKNSPTSMIVQSWGSSIPNDVARLRGVRLTTVNEIESGQKLAEAKVKQMTGGDTLTARFMREEFFDFRPQFKLWVRANHKPEILGTDEAMWRRIMLIPFNARFTPDMPTYDPYLLETLEAEAPGIMRWAIDGFNKWHTRRLKPPEKVQAATEYYRQESDELIQYLVHRVVVEPESDLGASDLFTDYNFWCENNNLTPVSQTIFGRRLNTIGLDKRRLNGRVYYHGIDLASELNETRQFWSPRS